MKFLTATFVALLAATAFAAPTAPGSDLAARQDTADTADTALFTKGWSILKEKRAEDVDEAFDRSILTWATLKE